MSTRTAGERVFAIRNADDEAVYAYGFGTYDGDFAPPGSDAERATYRKIAEAMDPPPADIDGLVEACVRNPRITLEGGGTVWGYQCWWGPAETLDDIAGWVKGRRIEYVEAP